VIRRGPRERQAEGDVHRSAEGRHLDGGHPHVVIGREHRVELPAQRPHEHGVGRERAHCAERFRRRPEHPLFLVAEQTALTGVRVHGADRQPR